MSEANEKRISAAEFDQWVKSWERGGLVRCSNDCQNIAFHKNTFRENYFFCGTCYTSFKKGD